MRRRVMSHNAKRMPRKLRVSHLSQMKKSGLPPKSERPSRRYRRRPNNLLLEYNKRQSNKFWLETHIWHAKRFNMIEKWGFKLANYSNDRCFRANYRAIKNHCLIQDISYYTCIEIIGSMEIIKEKLKMHCNPNELTFGAKIYTNGEREGTLMFYKKNCYPCHPIGYINFMWKANSTSSEAIWIWIHPAFYKDILEEITNNFNFKLQINSNIFDTVLDINEETVKDVQTEETSEFTIFGNIKIPTYTNEDGCQLIILRSCFNRFRLTGPLTLSVLTDALKIPNINSKFDVIDVDQSDTKLQKNSKKMDFENDQNLVNMDTENEDKSQNSNDIWYKDYYQCKNNLESFQIQKDMFKTLATLQSPSQLPPNMILALTVLDPRFFLPSKRNKSLPNSQIIESTLMHPTLANESPLWDSNIRNDVAKNCVPVKVINNLRSKNLVPGVENDRFYNEDIMQKIPILLIQRPGNCLSNNKIDFCSGIDIILPARWSMPFWLALILRCAKAGGLRESQSIAYENSNLNLPAINHPDTEAYNVEANYKKNMLVEKYFKFPPNKRINYTKFAITSPFYCEWKMLIEEWNNVDSFYVLRDHHILSTLDTRICMSVKTKEKNIDNEKDKDGQLNDLCDLIKNKNCFVPIKVTSINKGLPKDFSIICIPTKEDLQQYNEDKMWSGPVQSLKFDFNAKARETAKQCNRKNQRRLKKERNQIKLKSRKLVDKHNPLNIENYFKKKKMERKALKIESNNINTLDLKFIQNLYLPECKMVRDSCDREVIGYVTQGGFSYYEAKGVGLGYVILSSVLNFIKDQSNIVLIRNTTTRKFRICRLDILY
jgi:ribonuclease P/MRP protein subunit POP1